MASMKRIKYRASNYPEVVVIVGNSLEEFSVWRRAFNFEYLNSFSGRWRRWLQLQGPRDDNIACQTTGCTLNLRRLQNVGAIMSATAPWNVYQLVRPVKDTMVC